VSLNHVTVGLGGSVSEFISVWLLNFTVNTEYRTEKHANLRQ